MNSSNQAQLPLDFEKVKEEPSKPENGKLQLNQYKRFHYPKTKERDDGSVKPGAISKGIILRWSVTNVVVRATPKKDVLRGIYTWPSRRSRKSKRTKNKNKKKKIQRRNTKRLMIVVKKWNSGKKKKMDNVLHEDGSRGLHRQLPIRNGQNGVWEAVSSEMENGKENSYGFTFEKTQTIWLPPTLMRKVWRGNKWP